VKADMLAVVEAAMAAPMTAPVKSGAPAWYHPGRSGALALGSKVIAWFGELHPSVLAAFDLKGPASAFEIFLDAIPESKAKTHARPLFQPSPFPAVERDLDFVIEPKVTGEEIVVSAYSTERKII